MVAKLRSYWTRLLETLWFVPSIVGVAGVVVAVGMVELSARVDSNALARFPRVFGASADSSRSLLSAIAASVITVAGVTFSLTMVAVTQASGQFTPRVLRTFMRDRPTQVVLGIFVAIFAYCLIVLRTIRSIDESPFVPSLAVVLGIVLGLASMGALIFFVHHIATSLQASHLIERVGRETLVAIDRLFPETMAREDPPADASAWAALARVAWQPVPARSTGYVQGIDGDRIVHLAESEDLVVHLTRDVGTFVIEDTPIAWIGRAPRVGAPAAAGAGAGDLTSCDHLGRIARAFAIGTVRTIDQDAAFGVRQLVDIALKALSPGINDVTTAVTCIHWLGAVLVRVAGRRVETPFRVKSGVVRVVAAGPTFEHFLALSVEEIRRSAEGNVSVFARLLETLGHVAGATQSTDRRRAIANQVRLVMEHADRRVELANDRELLRTLTNTALRLTNTDAPDTSMNPASD